jgi:hypothetical protein
VTLASILALGFLLGMRHALDADHLAAVATLATRSGFGETVRQGVAWGAGHTLTLLISGGAVLLLGLAVPPKAAQGLEVAVGVMLVVLGADVLRQLRRARIHFHEHEPPPRRASLPLRALLVGMVHGMAGSAALVLLSLEAMPSAPWGLAYIAIFGLGSIIGMALFSAAIAVPLRLSSRRLNQAHGALAAVVGLATMALGGVLVYRIGITDGFFGG